MCEPAKKLPFAHLLTQTQTHEALAVHGFAPRTFCVDVCTYNNKHHVSIECAWVGLTLMRHKGHAVT